MSKIPKKEWTSLERRLDKLVRMSEAQQGLLRVAGRIKLANFIAKHGKESCDAMWERIK